MKSPAHDLALWMASEGVGTFGNTIHVSREPISPDDVVTLYDTGGSAPLLSDHAELRDHTIQVRVRNTDYPAGYEKQQEIARIIQGLEPFVTDDYEYTGIWMQSDIIAIGRDDNDRFLFTANYRVVREPLEAGS